MAKGDIFDVTGIVDTVTGVATLLMKGHPIKVAAQLHEQGYKPITVNIGTDRPHLSYCAWKGNGDHHWITKQQYTLLKNLYDAKIRSET